MQTLGLMVTVCNCGRQCQLCAICALCREAVAYLTQIGGGLQTEMCDWNQEGSWLIYSLIENETKTDI